MNQKLSTRITENKAFRFGALKDIGLYGDRVKSIKGISAVSDNQYKTSKK